MRKPERNYFEEAGKCDVEKSHDTLYSVCDIAKDAERLVLSLPEHAK